MILYYNIENILDISKKYFCYLIDFQTCPKLNDELVSLNLINIGENVEYIFNKEIYGLSVLRIHRKNNSLQFPIDDNRLLGLKNERRLEILNSI